MLTSTRLYGAIVFITKIIALEADQLSTQLSYKSKTKIADEEAILKREQAILNAKLKATKLNGQGDAGATEVKDKVLGDLDDDNNEKENENRGSAEAKQENQSNLRMVAICRIFSGNLQTGSEVYLLDPKHNPSKPDINNLIKITIQDNDLVILQGREVCSTPILPVGSIGGILNLDDKINAATTLSSNPYCTCFSAPQSVSSVPILYRKVEPVKFKHNKAFNLGLKKLAQVDPFIEIKIMPNGDKMLVASGEVHLEKCILDLETRFIQLEQKEGAKQKEICKIQKSSPIARFKETIIPKPKTDIRNEDLSTQNIDFAKEIEVQSSLLQDEFMDKSFEIDQKNGRVTLNFDLCNGQVLIIQVGAKPLSEFKSQFDNTEGATDTLNSESTQTEILSNFDGNLLVSQADAETNRLIKEDKNVSKIKNIFKIAIKTGPICQEPITGVAFIVYKIEVKIVDQEVFLEESNNQDLQLDQDVKEASESAVEVDALSDEENYTPTANTSTKSVIKSSRLGQFMAIFKKQLNQAFQLQPQRLLAAAYTVRMHICDVTNIAPAYDILASRHAIVLDTIMVDSNNTIIIAEMRIIDSIDLIKNIRSRLASAVAAVELNFTHWSLIDFDPYWTQSTQEEIEHFGTVDSTLADTNLARKYANDVRKRKGLKIFGKKVVVNAEKQKTLKKK